MKGLRYIICLAMLTAGLTLKAQTVSGDYQDKSLAYVLEDFSKKYALSFAYDSYAMTVIRGSWKFEESELNQALRDLLYPYHYEFKEVSGTLVIYSGEIPSEVVHGEGSRGGKLLHGEVRDSRSKELLPFVVLSSPDGMYSAISDADGKFSLDRERMGDTLIANYIGYLQRIVSVKEISAEDYLRLYLRPKESFLPFVLIEEERIKQMDVSVKPSIQTINPGLFTGAIGTGEADIYRVAQMLPGVTGLTESNNGLFIRGNTSDRSRISFDGFTLYQQDHFFGAFSAVNMNAVKNMRVHKSAPEARYGGRIGGLIEIVGSEGNNRDAHYQVDISPLSVAGLITTPIDSSGKATVVVAGRRSFTNALFSPTYKSMFNTIYNTSLNVVNDDELKTFGNAGSPELYFQDLNVKLTYRASERDVINVSLFASKDKMYMQYADTGSFEVLNLRDVIYTDETTKANRGAGLRWAHRWKNNWDALLTVGFSKFDGNYFSADTTLELGFADTTVLFYAENATLKDADIRAETGYTSKLHKLRAGVEFNRFDTYNKQNYPFVKLPVREETANVLSLYIQDEWDIHRKWTLRPGLRMNRFSSVQKFDTEPRLSLSYLAVPEKLRLKAAAAVVHQYIHRVREQSIYLNTPDYWQFSTTGELPVLRSEQYVLGATANSGSWTFDLEAYLNRNTGIFVNSSIYARSDFDRYRSELWTGKGNSYGVDFLARYDYKRLSSLLSYSFTDDRSKFETDIGLRHIPQSYISRHEGKIYIDYKPAHWSFSIWWIVGSGKPYTPWLGSYTYTLPNGAVIDMPVFGNLNSGTLPAYHRLDISAARHFNVGRMKGKIQLSVFNVYNRENVRDVFYLVQREGIGNNEYSVVERRVNMLPFLPSLNLQLVF